MKRLIVLGSNGMLGSEVLRIAKKQVDLEALEVLEVSRSSAIRFDATESEFQDLAGQIGLC